MPDRALVSCLKLLKTAFGSQQKHSSEVSHQERRGAISRVENSSRYFTCFKPIFGCSSQITEFATKNSCTNRTFESFKKRFSRYHSASEVSQPLGSFCSKLASYFKRPRRFGGRFGLQTRVHNVFTLNRPAPRPTLLKIELGQTRCRYPILATKRGPTQAQPEADQFLSILFIVPKQGGSSRPVINLKGLNSFLQYNHFKMEGMHLLRDLVQPGDRLGKIDVKDAYFVIPNLIDHRKYLCFFWKDTLPELACLLFGLALAPRLFTKFLKPIVTLSRRADIRLIIYLYDLLFMHATQEKLREDMATAR